MNTSLLHYTTPSGETVRLRRQMLSWLLWVSLPASLFQIVINHGHPGSEVIWALHGGFWLLLALNESPAFAWAHRLAVGIFLAAPLGLIAAGVPGAERWQAVAVVFAALVLGWQWGSLAFIFSLLGLAWVREMALWQWSEQALFLGNLLAISALSEQAIRRGRAKLRHQREELLGQILRTEDIQDEIRRTRSWLDHAQEVAHLGVMEVDLETGETYWSDQFFSLLGLKPGRFKPSLQRFFYALPPEDSPRVDKMVEDLSSGRRLRYQLNHGLIDAQGNRRAVQHQGRFLVDSKRPTLLVTLYDITAIESVHQQLQKALSEAHRASQAKTSFLANMSHELRTPLNGILGMVQLAANQASSDEQAEELKVAEESAQHLLCLLNQLLDMAQLHSDSLELEVKPFDLSGQLKGLGQKWNETFDAKGLSLKVELDSGLAPRYLGDWSQISRLLEALLHNAYKFSTQGEVCLKAAVEDRRIRLEVVDQGPGFDPARLDDFLNPFSQGEDGACREYGGAGLGLSLVDQLTRLMAGDLEVKTEPGQGCAVSVKLPLAVVEQEEHQGPYRGKVLLAEDNHLNRRISAKFLRHSGLEVIEAENGEAAVRYLSEQEFDFALLDLNMPVMDGYLTAKMVRSGQTLAPHIPLIALSGYSDAEHRQKADKTGFDRFLPKPLTEAALEELITAYGPKQRA